MPVMARFRYLAVDTSGRSKRGIVEAPDMRAAAEKLRSDGLWIVRLSKPALEFLNRAVPLTGGPKVKLEEFVVCCHQLATLYRAGISLVDALQIMVWQTQGRDFRKVLRQMAYDMQMGLQLSEAAAKHPSVFPDVYVSMVRAGEASGKLDEILMRLAAQYEKDHNTRAKMRSAMMYPAFLGMLTVVVSIALVTFILPRFVSSFQGAGAELPALTRMLIGLSDALKHTWFLLPLPVLLTALLYKLIRSQPKGRYAIDYTLLRIPVLGPLRINQMLSRFSRTFGTLHIAAVPVLKILSITSSVVGNEAIRRIVTDAYERVRKGEPIADAFRESPLIPPMVSHMIAIGEKSGALDTVLDRIAEHCESVADRTSDRLKSLLEPLMILGMAGIVGVIVMAMFLPVFRMMDIAQSMG
jgi:type IV pilus assembly protein PilC